MAVLNEDNILFDATLDVAKKMVVAARTAPKGKGESNMHSLIVTGGDLEKIAAKMTEMSEEFGVESFARDAKNILACDALVLLGTEIKPLNLKKCGMCGLPDCTANAKAVNIPCVFNTGDLGIAIGSAVSVAMDNRIDNRIMYTVGQAVKEMGLFSGNVPIIYGIPLKASSKNIFFERK